MTIILKWLRVSLEIIVSVVVMATGTALWLLMAVPDPVSILTWSVGFAMYFMAMADMDRCEKLARKKEGQSARIITTRQDVPIVPSLAAEKRL